MGHFVMFPVRFLSGPVDIKERKCPKEVGPSSAGSCGDTLSNTWEVLNPRKLNHPTADTAARSVFVGRYFFSLKLSRLHPRDDTCSYFYGEEALF